MAKAKKQNVGLYLRYRTPEGKQSPPRPVVWDSKKRLRPGWCAGAQWLVWRSIIPNAPPSTA
jgi:hypothetical protein